MQHEIFNYEEVEQQRRREAERLRQEVLRERRRLDRRILGCGLALLLLFLWAGYQGYLLLKGLFR